MTVAINDLAPDFDLPADGGGRVKLSRASRVRKLVLYFYPKDDTTGCTNEAKGFSEQAKAFAAAGAAVVGVSKDSVKSHDKFKAKYGLDLTLGSDPEGAMIERYGVWVEKSMYGRSYMGIERGDLPDRRRGPRSPTSGARSRSLVTRTEVLAAARAL